MLKNKNKVVNLCRLTTGVYVLEFEKNKPYKRCNKAEGFVYLG